MTLKTAAISFCLLSLCLPEFSFSQEAKGKPSLHVDMLGTTPNVHAYGTIFLAGQPSADDLAEAKKRGVRTVITLREQAELDRDDAADAKELGLEFHRFGFRGPDALTNDIFDSTLHLLKNAAEPTMLHCASANRVGAIWMAHRVINDGLSVEAAQAEAKKVGLKTPGYAERALAYIEQRQQDKPEMSVKPGINAKFLDPELDVTEWLGRFELESREVYGAREQVLKAIGLKPGMTIADIGAGTGFYSRLFADKVGETGWVFAVDISTQFLEHINLQAEDEKIANLTCVLGSDRSIRVPHNSIDAAFICDTYHHFEYPQATLASIRGAMKPGGTLVIIDFERIPGVSKEWTLDHVRAGKEEFKQEVIQAGFEFIEEVKIEGFQENYFLRFKNVK